MNYLYQFLLVFYYSYTSIWFALCERVDEKRFVIVSDSPSGMLLYPGIRDTKQPRATEPEVDVDTRKQICEDILSTYLFSRHGEYLFERNFCCLTSLFDGRLSCPTRTIPVAPHSRAKTKLNEATFVCLACRCSSQKIDYYISKEYNLDPDSVTSDSSMVGRFIFKKYLLIETWALHGLAELPGAAYSSPDHGIESLYIQRKKKYSIAYFKREDPLCKLVEEEQQRICTAAFNSKYFEEKSFVSRYKKVETRCELRTISFQSEYGKAEGLERRFRERTLICKSPGDRDDDDNNNYLISYAYTSNEIFTFVQSSDTADVVFPENLITNIRLKASVTSHRPWIQRVSEEDVYEDYHNSSA